MLSLRQAKNGMFLWKVLRAVVMLAGLLQLENSNFEGVLHRKFNALSRDAYRPAPTEELEDVARRKFAAGVSIPPQSGF